MCIEDVLKAVSELEGVEVAAFAPMTDSQQELMIERMAELEEQTSKLLQMNVKLENELDPSLLAGFKILVEGKIIDASYRKKFDELASQMNLS